MNLRIGSPLRPGKGHCNPMNCNECIFRKPLRYNEDTVPKLICRKTKKDLPLFGTCCHYKEGKILFLTLKNTKKEAYFHETATGEKKVETRENNAHWRSILLEAVTRRATDGTLEGTKDYVKFTHVIFVNGYGSRRPEILIEFKKISLDCTDENFKITLGNIETVLFYDFKERRCTKCP